MPWIRSKVNDENVAFIDGQTDELVSEQFAEFLAGQRAQGRTATELEDAPGEWEVRDVNGFIDIYYVA